MAKVELRANAQTEGRSFDAYDVNPPGADDTGLWVVSESYAGSAKAWFPTEEQAIKYAQEAALDEDVTSGLVSAVVERLGSLSSNLGNKPGMPELGRKALNERLRCAMRVLEGY